MKLTFSFKAVRTLGLMVLLSVMVGTSVQQSAQAQTRNQMNAESKVTCVPLTEGEFVFAFKGINLSPRLKAAYDRAEKALSEKAADLDKEVRKEVIPNLPPAILAKNGGISATLGEEISKAQDVLTRDNVPPAKQIELLTKRYGQFAEFVLPTTPVFTPEQLVTKDKIEREFEAQIMTVLTPEQQKVFRANLLRLRQIDACSPPRTTQASARQTQTIVDIAAADPNFSILVKAVKAAGLVETLSGKTPLTVFAPTNQAFAALPKGTLEKLLKPENRDLLRKVLTYHVVSGDLMAKNLRSGRVATVEGSPVAVRVRHGSVRVNNAKVVKADVDATNGVIHVIDRVLLPPGL